MTTTVAEAERVTALAEESGLVCAMGFNYRYLEAIGEIRNLVRSGELGSILFAEAGFRRGSALTRSRFTWRDSALGRPPAAPSATWAVHPVDMLDRLFDSPVDSTSCRTKLQVNVPQKEGQDVQVDDYAFVSGRLENGTFFNLVTSKSSLPEELGFFTEDHRRPQGAVLPLQGRHDVLPEVTCHLGTGHVRPRGDTRLAAR
ncbi:hypothetical protein SPURM210S_06916 [Streptomyces purpurascens]